MSSDLDDFEEQINELIKSIQTVLDSELPRLRGAEKSEKCQYLRNRVNRAKQVHRSIVVEVRGLEGSIKTDWEIKSKKYDEKITKLGQDIDWAEQSGQERDNGSGAPVKKHIEDMTAIEMTKHALMVQEKTTEASSRAKKTLDETVQIGVNVNMELKKQGEIIKEVDENLERVETNLRRADKQIRVFIRRMATDKIFLLLILLVVVGIVLAITFFMLKKQCPPQMQSWLQCGPAPSPSPSP